MQIGPQVDDREAYLDAVLLNIYSGPGTGNVWIDDLDVAGYVAVATRTARPSQSAAVAASVQSPSRGRCAPIRLPPAPPPTPVMFAPRHTVKLDRSLLLVDDRPMLPRVIQHRGEPLEVLKKIGFNAVWLQRLPAPKCSKRPIAWVYG